MRIETLSLLGAGLLWSAAALAADASPDCRSAVSGDLRLHTLESRIFGNIRTIRVLLPPGYDAPENRSRRYPVLYMLDGQNLFDACLSDVSHQEWGVDETVYRLVAERKIPPLIVVGVDHAGQRFRDFRTGEVMPLVDGQYRTLSGQPNTGIGGNETDNPAVNDRMVGLFHLVEANFRKAGYDDSNIRVVIEPDALHSEPAWASDGSRV